MLSSQKLILKDQYQIPIGPSLYCSNCGEDLIWSSKDLVCLECGSVFDSLQLEDRNLISNWNVVSEIKRICSQLGCPHKRVSQIVTFSTLFELTSDDGGAENSIPVIIFIFCKVNGYLLERQEILELCNLSLKEFNDIYKKIIYHYPKLQRKITKNRTKIIKQIIYTTLIHELNLEYYYFFIASDVLTKFWKDIGSTTNRNVATICVLIATLWIGLKKITIQKVFLVLGVNRITITYHIKKLLTLYKITGFSTLKESIRALLKKKVNTTLYSFNR